MRKFFQREDSWCGPASLEYALYKQGIDVSQEKLAEITGTTDEQGVDPEGMIRGAREFGMKTKTLSDKDPNETLNYLNGEVEKGKSVIVDYLTGTHPTEDDGHYSVLKNATEDSVKLWDPSMGRTKTLKKKTFFKYWRDTLRDGSPFTNWGMVIYK